MRILLFTIMLVLFSCSASTIVAPDFIKVNHSNSVVPVLFEAWSKKQLAYITEKLGPPDNVKQEHEKTLYSFSDSKVKDFVMLSVVANQRGELVSIYYVVLDEDSKIKKDWLLSNYIKADWREVQLPVSNSHSIVKKMILLNDKQKISAGYLEGNRNNQINYLYFDRDGENYKSKDLFLLE